MSLRILYFFLANCCCINVWLIDDHQLKKKWDLTGMGDIQTKVSVPNEYFERWWDIINGEMKNTNIDVSNGLTINHVEKFLGGILSTFIIEGKELERELYNLQELLAYLEVQTSSGITNFRRTNQLKKFVKKLALSYGLAHATEYIDQNRDDYCPRHEMLNHKHWLMDVTAKYTRIAKNLGFTEQRKLRRIYNGISSSTKSSLSTKIGFDDYQLCENKAVLFADIVIKIIPVYYDYVHKSSVDYCCECP